MPSAPRRSSPHHASAMLKAWPPRPPNRRRRSPRPREPCRTHGKPSPARADADPRRDARTAETRLGQGGWTERFAGGHRCRSERNPSRLVRLRVPVNPERWIHAPLQRRRDRIRGIESRQCPRFARHPCLAPQSHPHPSQVSLRRSTGTRADSRPADR